MILYFSGGTTSKPITEFMRQNNCSRLFSYYNDKKVIESKVCDDVFVDCGAWTAFMKGVDIDIDVYADYLSTHSDCFKLAASLDIIPKDDVNKSAEDSYNNFVYLRKKLGVAQPIIPTYHMGESIDNLKKLLDYSDEFGPVDYIGVGAVAHNKNRDVRDDFLNSVFTTIYYNRPGIKVHLFGLTDLALLDKYPIYSADSTTWLIAGAMGELITDFGRIKISDKNFKRDSVKGYSVQALEALSSYIQNYGFTLEQLQESTEQRQMFNILYMKHVTDNIDSEKVNFKPKKKLF